MMQGFSETWTRVECSVSVIPSKREASPLFSKGKRPLLYFILPLLLLFFIQFATLAKSDPMLLEIGAAYIDAAFSSNNKQLRKFKDHDKLTYRFVCDSYSNKKCIESVRYFEASIFENANMKLKQGEFGQFEVIFAAEYKLDDQIAKLGSRFSASEFDQEDKECRLFIKYDEKFVHDASILVSLDSSPPKIVSCLLLSFYRVVGLPALQGKTFSEWWKLLSPKSNGSSLDELRELPWFLELQKEIVILEYIHACSKLTAGMKKSEVEAELTKTSICFRGLLGGNNG